MNDRQLGWAARMLIIIYLPVALVYGIYYLSRRDTWRPSPNDGSVPDQTRYSKATRRSSAVYIVLNILLLFGAKLLGISYSNVIYNYVSLFVTTMITYVYDRCVSTDDGLTHFLVQPGQTIADALLSFCSPVFMRYLIVLVCDISLTVLIAYYLGPLISEKRYPAASTLFRKSIVPVIVYSVVTGPLRFAWAYPTVSVASRIPYLIPYIIAFSILALVTYASGRVQIKATAGILILMLLIATLLQIAGMSNSPPAPDLFTDTSVMPRWAEGVMSAVVLIATLTIGYKIFVDFLRPYVMNTSETAETEKLREAKEAAYEKKHGRPVTKFQGHMMCWSKQVGKMHNTPWTHWTSPIPPPMRFDDWPLLTLPNSTLPRLPRVMPEKPKCGML